MVGREVGGGIGLPVGVLEKEEAFCRRDGGGGVLEDKEGGSRLGGGVVPLLTLAGEVNELVSGGGREVGGGREDGGRFDGGGIAGGGRGEVESDAGDGREGGGRGDAVGREVNEDVLSGLGTAGECVRGGSAQEEARGKGAGGVEEEPWEEWRGWRRGGAASRGASGNSEDKDTVGETEGPERRSGAGEEGGGGVGVRGGDAPVRIRGGDLYFFSPLDPSSGGREGDVGGEVPARMRGGDLYLPSPMDPTMAGAGGEEPEGEGVLLAGELPPTRTFGGDLYLLPSPDEARRGGEAGGDIFLLICVGDLDREFRDTCFVATSSIPLPL